MMMVMTMRVGKMTTNADDDCDNYNDDGDDKADDNFGR